MPAGLAKTFDGSLIASVPGVNASWLFLGLLELVVVLGFVASLANREFLPSRRKPVLLSSMGLSMFAFAMMAFAENMVGGFATVAELFAYFSGTAVVIILISAIPRDGLAVESDQPLNAADPERGADRGARLTRVGSASLSAIDSDSQRTTIVLADDHVIVRSALRALLGAEDEFEVVAEAGAVDEAIRKVLAYKPDVIVLDLTMPGGSSLEAIPQILTASEKTAIVVLTMENEPRFAREALRAGALGFVLKEAADAELVAAVHAAARGQRYLNPQLGGLIASEPATPAARPDDLTEREVAVLRLVALGHTNAEISAELYMSVRTVESHRAHIQRKARRTTRAELVAYARENGLLA